MKKRIVILFCFGFIRSCLPMESFKMEYKKILSDFSSLNEKYDESKDIFKYIEQNIKDEFKKCYKCSGKIFEMCQDLWFRKKFLFEEIEKYLNEVDNKIVDWIKNVRESLKVQIKDQEKKVGTENMLEALKKNQNEEINFQISKFKTETPKFMCRFMCYYIRILGNDIEKILKFIFIYVNLLDMKIQQNCELNEIIKNILRLNDGMILLRKNKDDLKNEVVEGYSEAYVLDLEEEGRLKHLKEVKIAKLRKKRKNILFQFEVECDKKKYERCLRDFERYERLIIEKLSKTVN